jgi:hypothetical protein
MFESNSLIIIYVKLLVQVWVRLSMTPTFLNLALCTVQCANCNMILPGTLLFGCWPMPGNVGVAQGKLA